MKKEGLSFKIKGAIVLGAAVILLVTDLVTKQLVLTYLAPVGSVTVIPGLLEFSYLENTGVAFGLFQHTVWLITGVTLLIFIGTLIAVFRYRKHSVFSYAASAMILAGGAGNLVDRISRGFVVDFIHVLFFDYIFNFADSCITVGVVLLGIHVLRLAIREKKEEASAETAAAVRRSPDDGEDDG